MAVVLLEWVALQPMTTTQKGLDFVSTPTAAAHSQSRLRLDGGESLSRLRLDVRRVVPKGKTEKALPLGKAERVTKVTKQQMCNMVTCIGIKGSYIERD